MFIIHVVPLFTGTEITMSPSRHATCCCIVTSIHGIAISSGGPPGPCIVSLIVSPLRSPGASFGELCHD